MNSQPLLFRFIGSDHRTFSVAWASLSFLLVVLAANCPARGEIVVYTPRDMHYTKERTIPVMGLVRNETWMKERDYVIVNVNDAKRPVEIKIKDGYYFAGEIDIDDGSNRIVVEDKILQVYGGDSDTPAKGYAYQYGHTSVQDSCDECHEVREEEGFASIELIEPPEALCNWCHFVGGNPKSKKKYNVVHGPVAEGKCLACHLAHSSDKPKLLKAEKLKLCPSCHAKIYDDIKNKSSIHGPLAVGSCDICHAVHASDEPFLFKAPERETCLTCHGGADIFAKVIKDSPPHPGVNEGKCHQCHSGHASNNPKMMKKTVNLLCLDCHPEKSQSFHEEKGFSIYICGRCHTIHNPDTIHLIIKESKKLCDACHVELGSGPITHKVVAESTCFECHGFHESPLYDTQKIICQRCHPANEQYRKSHPVAMNENIRCSLCHAPHRAAAKKLARPVQHKPYADHKCDKCHKELRDLFNIAEGKDADALCLACHRDKRIPAGQSGLFLHKPFVRDTCRSCHVSHSSNADYLLLENAVDLCGRCHNAVKRIKSFQPASAHDDFKEGRCSNCHTSHMSKIEHLLKQEYRPLCLSCHKSLYKDAQDSDFPVVHPPFASGTCAQCHASHTARQPKLMLDKEGTLCRKCHKDFFKAMENPYNKFGHSPVKKGSCGSCHALHASPIPGLLKSTDNAACKTCHLGKLKGSHHAYQPDYETFTEGSLTKQRILCTACHKPHFSPNDNLLVNKDSLICRNCHNF